MTHPRTALVALGLAIGAAGVAPGAQASTPSKGQAAKALERRLERTYRDEFPPDGDVERAIVSNCKRLGRLDREIQYYCAWRLQGDPFEDARYKTPRPSGTAVVFASTKRPGRYRFLQMRGDPV